MSIKPIKTEKDYRNALQRMELLFDAPNGTSKSDEADIIAILIDQYEKKDDINSYTYSRTYFYITYYHFY